MKRLFFMLMMLTAIAGVQAQNSHNVYISINGTVVDTLTVADGAAIDFAATGLDNGVSDGLQYFWYQFAGWSSTDDSTNPTFFTPNNVVSADMTLYAMFYRTNENKDFFIPIQSGAELMAHIGKDQLFIGYDDGSESYFFSDPADYTLTDDQGQNWAVYANQLPSYSDRQEDGSYANANTWNKSVASFTALDTAATNTYYSIAFGNYQMGWCYGDSGKVFFAGSSASQQPWDITFQNGYATLHNLDNYLDFDTQTLQFYGTPSLAQSHMRIYYLAQREDISYTTGYHVVTLGDIESVYGYYNYDGDQLDYQVDYQYLEDTTSVSGNDRQIIYLYVLNGASVSVEAGTEKVGYELNHWNSSFLRYDGDTANPIMICPTSDMTLTPVFECAYWIISLPRMEYEDSLTAVMYFDRDLMYGGEEQGGVSISSPVRRGNRSEMLKIFMDQNCYEYLDSTNETSVECDIAIFVRKGEEVTLFVPYLFATNGCRFGRWISDYAPVDSSTVHPLTFTPTANMTLDFALSLTGAVTTIGTVSVAYNDTSYTPINLTDDGSVQLVVNNGSGQSELTFNNASITGSGVASELNNLLLSVAANSSITSNGVGVDFGGGNLTLSSNDTSLLKVAGSVAVMGNGVNSLTINGAVILSAQSVDAASLLPAVYGFAEVVIAEGLSIQEVWYGNQKGNPGECEYSPIFQCFGMNARQKTGAPRRAALFGEINPETWHVDNQSFVPATSICIASPTFYVDYIDGKIDIATGLEYASYDFDDQGTTPVVTDDRCYDILGRPLDGPQPGLYIQHGRVHFAL